MTVEEDFEAYKERVTRHPKAFVLDVYVNNEVHKYHCAGRETFIAICAQDGKFKRYIPHVHLQ